MSNSLVSLLKNDPILARRLKKTIGNIKNDTKKLKNIAKTYNTKYKKEIEEGTRKKALLLLEANKLGKDEVDVDKHIGFLPTIHTPILNFLYFILREGNEEEVFYKNEYDKKYGYLEHENNLLSEENLPEMVTYLYGNITLETFNKLKKLKALSKSPNEKEAFLAYRKCLRLCKKYNLEFDKIP